MTCLSRYLVLATTLGAMFLSSAASAAPLRSEMAPRETECDYQTISMLIKYAGEEHVGGYYSTAVKYYGPLKREAYRVYVRDGLLLDAHGLPIDWKRSEHTDEYGAALMALYVMDACGRIYLTYHHEVGIVQHSSFLAGGPVASAGEALIVEGRLLLINNSSGHYRPVPFYAIQVIDRLDALGADLDITLIDMVASPY